MQASALRRRSPALADQAVSSLTNVIVVVIVARSFDLDGLGAFGAAMVAYQLFLGGFRSLVCEPFLSLYSPTAPAMRHRLASDLVGTSLLLSLACSAGLAAVSASVGGVTGSALLAMAAVLPLVLHQDLWRFVFIIDRPSAALAIDVVWLVGVVCLMVMAPDGASVAWFVVAWGLAGGAGGLAGLALGRGLPSWPHPWRWLVDHWSTAWQMFGDFVTSRGVSQFALVGLSTIADVAALGAVKAVDVVFGPMATLHSGIALAVVPEAARSRDRPQILRRVVVVVSAVMGAVAALVTLVALLVPDDWGRALMRENWAAADALILPMGLAMIPNGVASGALIGIRALGDARNGLRARLWSAPLQITCPLAGAWLDGAKGFVLGLAVGRLVAAFVWWRMFDKALSDPVKVLLPARQNSEVGRASVR